MKGALTNVKTASLKLSLLWKLDYHGYRASIKGALNKRKYETTI